VTDVAGLGLGPAVAGEKVARLGGTITAATRAEAGTSFRIVVPLPLSRLRGVLVRVGDHILAVPATKIARVVQFKPEGIKTVEGRETLLLDGRVVSLCSLGDVLELDRPAHGEQPLHAVVVAAAKTQIAFAVDEVLREGEIVARPWGRQLSRVRNVAGAAVLGNGTVVPILHADDLVKSAVYLASAPAP
jgi:two-component system, chemotaxis family, sensor kinase CheA